MQPPASADPYSAAQIAERVETVGVAKATMPALQTFMLALLAGAFIAFGGMFYLLVTAGSDGPFGFTRLLGGLAFSTGLILVVIGGAELFTGNNLIVMAWADRRVTTWQLLRNWAVVYAGNLAGAFGTVALYWLSGALALGDHAVATQAAAVAAGKLGLGTQELFFRGILCNTLVCLAVWMSYAGRSVVDKVVVIVFPITAFVALGFEHSVANMFLLPLGVLAAERPEVAMAIAAPWRACVWQLAVVTAGNLVGGAVFVALIYFLIYKRCGARGL